MYRLIFPILVLLIITATGYPSYADDITAQEIFESMIYYDSDQLETRPGTTNYHCTIIQKKERVGSGTYEIMEKEYYFMTPAYSIDFYDETPAHYYDPDGILATLETQQLDKLRDETINSVDCYVIRLTPKDPIYRDFPSTYYVAKDDFRHVRTVNHSSIPEYLNVIKTLDYRYTEVEDFTLITEIVVNINDVEGNLLYTVTAAYVDYEFNVDGIDLEFFLENSGDMTVNPSWN